MSAQDIFDSQRSERLNNPRRLQTQVAADDLRRLLALDGCEDVADLGSGTGFYTDIVAGLTSGLVYAVELQPEMIAAHGRRGLPVNVRPVQGDIRSLSLPEKSIDAAFSIAVHHEIAGHLGLDTLLPALRFPGRLVIIDWRADPESWEDGPPAARRFDKHAVADSLRPFFRRVTAEDVGPSMFGVVARELQSGEA